MSRRANAEAASVENYRSTPEQRPDLDSVSNFFSRLADGRIAPRDQRAYTCQPFYRRVSGTTRCRVEMNIGGGHVSIRSTCTNDGGTLCIASRGHVDNNNNFLAVLESDGGGVFAPSGEPVLDCDPVELANRYRAYEALQRLQAALVPLCYIQTVSLPQDAIHGDALPSVSMAASVTPHPGRVYTEPDKGPHIYAPPLLQPED